MQEKEYWTVQEVALRLRVSERTVQGWVTSGELPAIRVGKRMWRILDSDLTQFIESRKHPQDKN